MTSQEIKSIPSNAFSTSAKRPVNARLDTTKTKKTFMLELPHWKMDVAAMLKLALINT
jgi:dTDP-4-dehydrorhamnose reductase